MDCQKLHSDIEKLKSLRDEFASQLRDSEASGLGKSALSSLSGEISSSNEALLEEYAYDLVEQNINDPNGKNSEFLKSVLEQYIEQDEDDPNLPGIPINPDVAINEVRDKLEEYLKIDKDLDNNLVVYALKERLGLLPNQPTEQSNSILSLTRLEELYKDILPNSLQDKTLPKLAYLHKIAERVKNLEVLETENYIFMLPKDKWEEGKIKLPNPENNSETPEYIAPNDLTAILKSPVYYDWNYETDGRRTDNPTPVYDEKWVGKEIRHFPWSKELIQEANEKLLKPNGYHIPESWKPIVDNLTAELVAREREFSWRDIRASEIYTALRERLGLAFSGYVWKDDLKVAGGYGYFWSASEKSADRAYCLYFDSDVGSPENWKYRDRAQSVRCVAES